MSKTAYRFGDYELDPKRRELSVAGTLLTMPPKSFECVAYLIEHRDRAVGRDELISAVWASTDVSDHTLGQTLLRARQVMGDVSPDRTMIRTVSRFGYRWIAPVEIVSTDDVVADHEPAVAEVPIPATSADDADPLTPLAPLHSPISHSTRPVGLPGLLAAVLVVLAAAAALFWQWHPSDGQARVAAVAAPVDERPLFIVLPVQLSASDPESAWIRLGVMDYIANLIRQQAGQQVLPSDQVISVVRQQAELDPSDVDGTAAHLQSTSGASHVIKPSAEYSDGRWFFSLEVTHGDGVSTYHGNSDVPLQATAQAVSAMLAHLNLANFEQGLSPLPSDELLQKIDAALLMGQLREAHELIAHLGDEIDSDPRFLIRAGNLAVREGRLDEADAYYRAVTGDTAALAADVHASAWMGLGAVALNRVDNDGARRAYSQALDLLDGSSESRLIGRSYMGRGSAYVGQGELEAGVNDFGRARIELGRANDQIGLASLEINIGMAEANRGRLAQALEAQDRAIQILTSFGVRDQLVISLHNKTYTQMALLDVPGALATSAQAMDQVVHLTNQAFNRRIAAARTRTLIAAGRLGEADAVIARFDDRPDDPVASDTEFAVLRLRLMAERGNFDMLVEHGQAGIDRIRRSVDRSGQASLSEACLLVVDAALRVGDIALASRVQEQLASAPVSVEDPGRPVIEQLIHAELGRATGSADAPGLFATALAIATERGAPELIVTVAYSWLRHLLADHDLDQAASVAGRLDAYVESDYRAARVTAELYRQLERTSLAGQAKSGVHALAGERDPSLSL